MSLLTKTFKISKGSGISDIDSFLESVIGRDIRLLSNFTAVSLNENTTQLTIFYKDSYTNSIDISSPVPGLFVSTGNIPNNYLFQYSLPILTGSLTGNQIYFNGGFISSDRIIPQSGSNNYILDVKISDVYTGTFPYSGTHVVLLDKSIKNFNGNNQLSTSLSSFTISSNNSVFVGNEVLYTNNDLRGVLKVKYATINSSTSLDNKIKEILYNNNITERDIFSFTTVQKSQDLTELYLLVIVSTEPKLLSTSPRIGSVYPSLTPFNNIYLTFDQQLDTNQIINNNNLFLINTSFNTYYNITSPYILLLSDKRTIRIDINGFLNFVGVTTNYINVIVKPGLRTINGTTLTKPYLLPFITNDIVGGSATIVGGSGVGPQGPQGPTGATGISGLPGSKWYISSGNPDNAQGSSVDFYLDVENGFVYSKSAGSWSLSGSIRGPTGATGAQGLQGLQGDIGPSGATGAQGIQGIQGPSGATGSTGAQGPQGPAGVNASGSVIFSGSFPYLSAQPQFFSGYSLVEFSGSAFITPTGAAYAGGTGGLPWQFSSGLYGYSGSGAWQLVARGLNPNVKLNPPQIIPRAGAAFAGELGTILNSQYGGSYNNIPSTGPYILDVNIYDENNSSIGLSVGDTDASGHSGRYLRLLLGSGLTQGIARGFGTYDVKLDLSDGLMFNGNQVKIKSSQGLSLSSTGLYIDAGPGLQFTGNQLTLYPGLGIRVRANDHPTIPGLSFAAGTGILFGTLTGDLTNPNFANVSLGTGLVWDFSTINVSKDIISGATYRTITGSDDFNLITGGIKSGDYIVYDSFTSKWINRSPGMIIVTQTGDFSLVTLTGFPWSNNTYIDNEYFSHLTGALTGSLNDYTRVAARGTEPILIKKPGLYCVTMHFSCNASGSTALGYQFFFETGNTAESGNSYTSVMNTYIALASTTTPRHSSEVTSYFNFYSGQYVRVRGRRQSGTGVGQTLGSDCRMTIIYIK